MKTVADARTRMVYEGWNKKPVQAEQDGVIIFNAPRPLYGETWTGDFISGVFYAAVDTGNQTPSLVDDCFLWQIQIDKNVRLDAAVLTWFNDEDLDRFTKEYTEWLSKEYNRPIEYLMKYYNEDEMVVRYMEMKGVVGDE